MRYMEGFYQRLEQMGVVPVVVLESADHALPVANALKEGGLTSAEITFRTPVAADAIHLISTQCPNIVVGAGTVLNVRQARKAVDAGARFVVSPGFDPVVVDWCVSQRMPVIPAGVTPTEITALINKGIPVTKFFPANLYGGLDGIKTMASVFSGHRFMPTGGVNPANLREYLACPAVIACGGTWLTKKELIAEGDFARIEALAAETASIVREVHGS